ncbi:MAG TPA: hypothetical protein VNU92_14040 [Edaphobacter sp.]|jgi:hypothetical protein|nr:hypothetical protein [Edaphobacter sp.]
MKLRWIVTLALCLFLAGSTFAQRKPIPKPVFAAKTIAIVNHAHNDGVEAGALESLKRWGKFTVVDDPDTADIVLTFEKVSEHESKSTQTSKDNNDGKQPETSSSFSMSFGSNLTMKATMKGSTTPFYSATNNDSKKKGGAACVVDFQSAYNQDR